MTRDDDGLAPVTPLFGRRGAGAVSAEVKPSGLLRGSGSNEFASRSDLADIDGVDGWALPDRTEHVPASDRQAGSGQPSASGHPAGSGRPAAASGGNTPRLSGLPRYAAFAAMSENLIVSDMTSLLDHDSGDRTLHDRELDDSSFGDRSFDDAEDGVEIESLPAARSRAENISMHALTRRGVSSSEMVKALRSRDLPEEVVLSEVERLERVGLLDDSELAENLVRSKQERKGLGKSAINAELRQRGLAQEVIDAALSEIDDAAEQIRADDWAIKRAGQLHGLDHQTAERRLTAFLLRRGYRSEVARRAIEKALPRGSGSSSGAGSGRGGTFGRRTPSGGSFGRRPTGGGSSGTGVRFD